MHVIDGGADAVGERDGGARAGNVGAQTRNDWRTASRNQSRRFRNGRLQRSPAPAD